MTTMVVKDGSPSPFSRAIDEFLGDIALKRDDKNPFLKELIQQQGQLPTTNGKTAYSEFSADALRSSVERLEREKSAGSGIRLLARVSPFIDALQKLMAICENAVQASPFGVSIAFAGARIVLELANKVQGYLNQVVDTLATIGRILKCYELFASAHQHSTDVQDLLVSSYKKIIEFWYDTSRQLSQNNFRLVIKGISRSLDKEGQKALDGLRKDSVEVLHLSHATHVEQQRLDREVAQKQGIVRWIKGATDDHVDVRTDLRTLLDRRHTGTCQWILEDQRFKEWQNARDTSVLWYNAKPGSGKSVVASTIVEHLEKVEGQKVVYFFYSFNDPLRRYGIHGLRSLALQLLTLGIPIPESLVKAFQHEMKHHATALSVPDLACHVVNDLLKRSPNPVYFVIDGLDECRGIDGPSVGPFGPFLNDLERLVRMKTYGVAKWLFTSRNHPGIRDTMQLCQAIEIQAETATISKDILTYFSDPTFCQQCVEDWTRDEDNFLYAKLIRDTKKGEGISCHDDISEKLRQLPNDLNGYYIRSLQKLLSKSDEAQELARRTFLILANAFRPLSSDELRDLLAVRPESQDYAKTRVPSFETILDLCAPLVEVESSLRDLVSGDNPTLVLCHKSVLDFFNQDPKVFGEHPDLHKFFASPAQANEELGRDCLKYLRYKRYQEPGLDLTALLSIKPVPKDHAFLRYAATFWADHLRIKPQSSTAIREVIDFLKSPAFWNCMSVQSHVTPYTYGTFVRLHGGRFDMRAKGSGVDYFGVPLPGWMDDESPEGMSLVRSLYCFVDEWREVLTTSPGGLLLCPPLRKFGVSCLLTPPQKQKSVRVVHLGEVAGLKGALSEMHLLRVGFRGKSVWADVLFREEEDCETACFKRVEVPLFSNKNKPSEPLVVSIPVEAGDPTWAICSLRQAGSPPKFEAWNLDPNTLGLKRMSEDGQSIPEQTVPLPIAQNNAGRRKGVWEVASTQDLEPTAVGTTSLRILHASWRRQSATTLIGTRKSEAAEDSDSETDSSDGEKQVTHDDTESDDDSDDEIGLQSEDNTEAENESSDTDCESDLEDQAVTDCHYLVVVPYSGQPLWHAWSSPPQVWSKVTCAMHPFLSLIAVTHTRRQVEVINIPTWATTTKHLPEVADLQEVPPGSLRELRFSPCGSYLHLLSISFTSNKLEAITTAHVSLSTFHFNHDGNSSDTLLRKCPAQTCSYSFGEALGDVQTPLALSFWTDREVTVALPPLTCDPKILMISLPQGSDVNDHDPDIAVSRCVWTLQQPIYFPTSTPKRKPCLMHRTDDKDDSGYIYLSLDALNSYNSVDAVKNGSLPTEPRKPSTVLVSPPVILRWKVSVTAGWRPWKGEEDGRASDLKRGLSVWDMLKGGFTDTDKSFSVVTRSGTDWKRKGFLSCS